MIIPEGNRNIFYLWAHKIDMIDLYDVSHSTDNFEYYILAKDLKFQNNDIMDHNTPIAKQVLIVEKSKKRFLITSEGDFWQITPKQFSIDECVDRLKKAKAIKKASAVDSRIFEFALQFQINIGDSTSKLDMLYNKYKSMTVPTKYRKVNGYFYRGMKLNKVDFDKLKKDGNVQLQKRLLTSWSSDKNSARKFAMGSYGVVLKVKDTMVDVFLNLSHKDFDWTPHAEEKEIIVRGNGIDTISKEIIEK